MKSRICCDYRTTILSNSFFHATTLLSIYHEKFSNLHRFGFEQKLSRIDGSGLKYDGSADLHTPIHPLLFDTEKAGVNVRITDIGDGILED